jgi:hypothetical protein
MDNLETRCTALWAADGIPDYKIKWLVSQLTQDAKDNNSLITDHQIRVNGSARLMWYGLGDAIKNYLTWEEEQV